MHTTLKKLKKSFKIIIDEIDESIDWIFSRLDSYPKTVEHEFNYTMDIAVAYRKKIRHMYSDLHRTCSNIIDPEIRQVYDINLEEFDDRICMIEEIIQENSIFFDYQDSPKYYS